MIDWPSVLLLVLLFEAYDAVVRAVERAAERRYSAGMAAAFYAASVFYIAYRYSLHA